MWNMYCSVKVEAWQMTISFAPTVCDKHSDATSVHNVSDFEAKVKAHVLSSWAPTFPSFPMHQASCSHLHCGH
jgi:hypothetical protein